MNLRERLDWAYGLTAKKPVADENMDQRLGELPWGEVIDTLLGTCVRVTEEFPLGHYHGRVALRELLERKPRSFGALARSAHRPYALPEELLFLDTETTGLAGGSGTVAFLVGLGYFRDNGFVLEQYFARDFDEEPALLHLVRQRLRKHPVWVSYNGKTYDIPLLNQRLIFHRLERELQPELHLDLLYPVRRFWKTRLGQCTLGHSERELLGVERSSDVPSYLVPEIYFRYLRERAPWPLRPVFDHNIQDVLSLVGLLNTLARLLERPETFQGEADVLQAGRMLADRRRYEEAVRVLQRTLAVVADGRERKRVLLDLARLYKRLGCWEKAVPDWREALGLPGFSAEPYVELAKYYEHRTRELAQAEKLTRRALEGLRTVHTLNPTPELSAQEKGLQHRLQRLSRKLRTTA